MKIGEPFHNFRPLFWFNVLLGSYFWFEASKIIYPFKMFWNMQAVIFFSAIWLLPVPLVEIIIKIMMLPPPNFTEEMVFIGANVIWDPSSHVSLNFSQTARFFFSPERNASSQNDLGLSLYVLPDVLQTSFPYAVLTKRSWRIKRFGAARGLLYER